VNHESIGFIGSESTRDGKEGWRELGKKKKKTKKKMRCDEMRV
jgi:hypothetical protein